MEHQQNNNHQTLQTLCEAVEQRLGRKPKTPKDFDNLMGDIWQKTHERISASTLMRIWGYTKSNGMPRIDTLNILAHYLDYADYASFVATLRSESISPTQTTPEPVTSVVNNRKKSMHGLLWICIALFIALPLIAVWHFCHQSDEDAKGHMLCKGEYFATYDEYLSLFGINTPYEQHYKKLPDYPDIVLWGPQYQHPQYHNSGDSAALFPTISEYFTGTCPDSANQTIVDFNEKRYYQAIANNEVRCVFMQNLVDSGFVFLGVYRMSLNMSNTDSVVWVRVADSCDLSNLEALIDYRN
ncbi:MAG: hypothetical protein IJ635_04125 [Bacteroidaceae bacterium]|nr:hypothetical protein [Bacteroidaceae bacterium]